MSRLITHTSQEMKHPWPDGAFVQGGGHGLVFGPDGKSYVTAFVEVSDGNTFLRGEGASLEAAEDACWTKYVVWRDCPHDGGYDPGEYTNGCGFCVLCRTWLYNVLPVLPPDPDRKPSMLERAFTGEPEAEAAVLSALARHIQNDIRSDPPHE